MLLFVNSIYYNSIPMILEKIIYKMVYLRIILQCVQVNLCELCIVHNSGLKFDANFYFDCEICSCN